MNNFRTLYVFLGLFCCTNAILLFDESKSFAIYDVWNITTVGKLQLEFKTNSKYSTLLYVDNQRNSQFGQYDKNDESYLEIALIQGRIQVTQQIVNTQNKERFLIGENLNNLKWHTLVITKYVESLRVEVDEQSHMISFSESISKKFRIESKLYIGGLSENKIKFSYGSAKKIPR